MPNPEPHIQPALSGSPVNRSDSSTAIAVFMAFSNAGSGRQQAIMSRSDVSS
ncbi:MAG: hypothetical protein NTY19_28345 [Planctomycetota bacterium]|nr:hypothetical protein [Planctomycetota bacterium]